MSQLLELTLAGLLHDVGKLGQRAHAPGTGLSAEAAGLEAQICPTWDGRPSHLHVLYTAEFIIRHALPRMPRDMNGERVLRLASYHHRPEDSVGSRLMAEADRLSAGMERDAGDDAVSGTFRSVRLRAVTSAVGEAGGECGTWVHGLAPLSPSAAFPEKEDARPANRTMDYAKLWEGLCDDWSRLGPTDAWRFTNRALSVLERYTWCIPSATNVIPDISLFDHLKTTAAIACCLSIARERASPGDPEFLLASGEFGGIQRFIYDIEAGQHGLARRLRARSLRVWLAAESAAHAVLRRLGLSLANCILSAGGRFTLLLPNTESAHAALADVTHRLAEWARDATGCVLQPHVAAVPVTADELGDFAACLDRLALAREEAKARPLGALLSNEGRWDEAAFVLPIGEDADADSDAKLGSRLAKARYAALSDKPGLPWGLPFGSFALVEGEREIPGQCYVALDLDGGCGELQGSPVVGRFVARHVPRHPDGGIVEFTDLAGAAQGRVALAYLKADVDNLGRLFSHGFRRGEADLRSISRIATLSRSLEVFFAGHVQRLAEERDVYLVYSGGDDLLAVGAWDGVLDMAAQLRSDLRAFTCGNPAWSLSAGVVVVNAHTPSLVAAEEADVALESAKAAPAGRVVPVPLPESVAGGPPGKDHLTALGTSIPWSGVPAALAQARALGDWLVSRELSTGQARRLLTCAGLFQQWQRTGDVLCFRYAPMLVYDLNRNWQKAPPAARDWAKGLTLRDSRDMPYLRFVCEYALYGARGTERTEEMT